MIILLTATLAAAQPTVTTPATPPVDAHAQHQQMGMMSEKEMADCHKCCEEMMAKMHEGYAKHSDHKPK